MTWLLAIVISVGLVSISTILQRTILDSDKSDPVIYSILFQLLAGVLLTVYGFLVSDMNYSAALQAPLNLLLVIGLYGFGNIAVFSALKQIQASEFSLVFASKALFTIVSSFLLLKESLTPTQIVGVILIFVSIWLVTSYKKKLSLSNGTVMALLAAACFGLANTNDKILLDQLGLHTFLSLGFLLPVPFMMLIYWKKTLALPQTIKTIPLKKLGIMTTIYSVAAIMFFLALDIAPQISPVVTINLTQTIFVVLLGVIFLNERERLVTKSIAAVFSLIGSLLLL